ncbi:hypothetical protein RB619_17135 [Flavobacterium sp. LHD-80]|uniref:hypothetical protein n=1 Tax=Flavobacterium sp. LHD-80 TaxID=3071411 RepID=UPI0027E17886|nr:hypothetical protein [Flavobacterium sp. LHD-80]MDQ6472374.1 hypothetical protein [Flavobacterium sp. LHD-80]
MRKIITFFILAISLISCSSESDSNSGKSGIYGKWNWVRTDGGIAFHLHSTPASTGNSIQLSLNKDKTFSITKNGKTTASGNYEITMQKSIFTGEMEKFISCNITENLQESLDITIRGIITNSESNKLEISENNPDGIGSGFVRIK